MSWEALTAEWDDMREECFEINPEGDIGTYNMNETSYGNVETIVTFVYSDGTFKEYPETYYDLYCFTPGDNGFLITNSWRKIWTSQPLGKTVEIGRAWMDAKLEMID